MTSSQQHCNRIISFNLRLAGEGQGEDGNALEESSIVPPGHTPPPVPGEVGEGNGEQLHCHHCVEQQGAQADPTQAVDGAQQAQGEGNQDSSCYQDKSPQGVWRLCVGETHEQYCPRKTQFLLTQLRPKNWATIGGAKSPMMTKNAMQVPKFSPIIL